MTTNTPSLGRQADHVETENCPGVRLGLLGDPRAMRPWFGRGTGCWILEQATKTMQMGSSFHLRIRKESTVWAHHKKIVTKERTRSHESKSGREGTYGSAGRSQWSFCRFLLKCIVLITSSGPGYKSADQWSTKTPVKREEKSVRRSGVST